MSEDVNTNIESQSSNEPIRFEGVLQELQDVVGRLNHPELSLDDAMKLYARGVELSVQGRGLLSAAEKTISELRQGVDGDEKSTQI